MEIVYIETTVVGLLVANPSRDLATAGQQQTTRDWWQRRRTAFQCWGGCRPFAPPWSSWEIQLMKPNPILEEVWRIKDELAREAGYDIHRLCENTRQWAETHPHSGPVVGAPKCCANWSRKRSANEPKPPP